MKYIGSYFEYEDERNKDLMRAYKELMESSRELSLRNIYDKLVNMPSCRFWVSEERAAIVVSSIMKGARLEKMRPTKREMYFEIYRQVKEARKRRPDASIYDLTFDVVCSPAPKFYLSPGSAKVIIYKIKRQWYEERKQKLRHCLW